MRLFSGHILSRNASNFTRIQWRRQRFVNGGGGKGAIGFVREAAFMCLIGTVTVLSMRYYMSYDFI